MRGQQLEIREAESAADASERFVYITSDGFARELTKTECEYLATAFSPFDGGRPYVKSYYSARTPDGLLHGFLERAKLPGGTSVATRAAQAE